MKSEQVKAILESNARVISSNRNLIALGEKQVEQAQAQTSAIITESQRQIDTSIGNRSAMSEIVQESDRNCISISESLRQRVRATSADALAPYGGSRCTPACRRSDDWGSFASRIADSTARIANSLEQYV